MVPSKTFENFQKFRIFSNNFKFIDDLCNLDYKEFENNYNDICPDELELKKEDGDCFESSCFWNWAETHDKKLTRKLFDKKDVFSFYINRIPYLDINIQSKIFYASIGFEIILTARTIANLINMVTCADSLLIPLIKQSSDCTRIIWLLKKIFGKHFKAFHTFANTADLFTSLISF